MKELRLMEVEIIQRLTNWEKAEKERERHVPKEPRSQPSERMFRRGACTVSTKYPGLSSHSYDVDSSLGLYLQFTIISKYVHKSRTSDKFKCHHNKKRKKELCSCCLVVRVKPNNDSEIMESKKEKYRGKRERRLMTVELARTYKCACMSQAGECKGAVDWRDGE